MPARLSTVIEGIELTNGMLARRPVAKLAEPGFLGHFMLPVRDNVCGLIWLYLQRDIMCVVPAYVSVNVPVLGTFGLFLAPDS